MAERICDNCGKKKPVSGGKTCENGHFICQSCVVGGMFDSIKKQCPIDKKPLR